MKCGKRKSRFEDSVSESSDSADDSSSQVSVTSKSSSLKIRAPKGKFLMTFKRTVDCKLRDNKKSELNSSYNVTSTTADEEDGHLPPNAILLIGPKHTRVKVMKEILQIQSPIFKARLSDAAAASSAKVYRKPENESTDEDFPVFYFEDVELEPFQNFLRYLYSTEPNWNWSMVKVRSKGNLVTSVLSLKSLARKFGVKNLEDEIDKSIENLMTSMTQNEQEEEQEDSKKMKKGKILCEIFEQAKIFDFVALRKIALQTILRTPQLVFNDVENFKILKPSGLAEILIQDDLECTDEVELFHLVLKWSNAQTFNYEGEEEEMLKEVLPFIRFTQMTLNEFMDHVYPAQVLDNSFIGQIIPYLYWKDHQSEIATRPPSEVKMDKVRKYTVITNSLTTLLPLKLWSRILQYLTKRQLMLCRLVSKHFQKIIDEQFSLEVILDENLLDRTAGQEFTPSEARPHLHSFSRIIVFLQKCEKENFTRLLRFVEFSKCNVDSLEGPKVGYPNFFLELNMDCVSSHHCLLDFLKEVMIKAPSLKINLKISSITGGQGGGHKLFRDSDGSQNESESSSEIESDDSRSDTDSDPGKAKWIGMSKEFTSISFFQITSVHFEFLDKVELDCLVQMTRQSPNLTEISLGNFVRRTKREDLKQTPNLVEFLNTANLDKLKLSMANLGHNQLSIEFFQDLKQRREVVFKKVNLDYDNRIKTLKFVNIFSDGLEEIYDLQIQVLATIKCLMNPLPKLRILSINCSVQWLLFVLQKTPELQTLFWSEIRSTDPEVQEINCLEWTKDDGLVSTVATNSAIQLRNLTRIVMSIKREENFQVLKFLASVSPNVKSLSFEISLQTAGGNGKDNNLTGSIWIYNYFPRLEQLEICESQESAILVVTGFRESELCKEYKNPGYTNRPPYIGNLTQLRNLNLGLMDYQELAKRWKWRVHFGLFSCGIGHLINLREITFPPLEIALAKRILTFFQYKMKWVKSVKFQVWDLGRRDNRNGTMTRENVEDLKERFGSSFETLEVILLLQDDSIHYTTWI